ncbi:MAG: tetratricopeptide repeat protein [Rubricoccaceae bacterium]
MLASPAARLACAGLLVCAAALAGCAQGSPLHNRYNNFRAYYNTYYNASRALEQGERSLQTATTALDRSRLVDVFPVARATAAGRDNPFQKAIDKSAELLRSRPTSRWADNALLVIGKAYFYQGNVVGAEQKFRETLAVADGDRRLTDEARFWLGRTLAAAGRPDEAASVLTEDLDGSTRFWRPRLRLALGSLYARAGRYDDAVEALEAGAADVSDADLAARGLVLLGQVHELAGRPAEAAAAFERAHRRKPSYELAFAAELSQGLAHSAAGQHDAALAVLRRMRRDDKHFAHRAEIELALARALAAAGRRAEAQERFRAVLYDQALGGNALRGEAHYRLGEFYRDVLRNYVRASAHFDTAATSLRAPDGRDARLARDAIAQPTRTASTFNAFARAATRLAEVDSLLALGALPEDAFRERIARIEAARLAEFEEQQRRQARLRDAQAFGEGAAGLRGGMDGGRGGEAGTGSAAASQEAGYLGFRSPTSVQAGLAAFQSVWGDRPLAPNWRRRAAISAGAVASGVGAGLTQGQFQNRPSGVGPRPLDLSPVPRTPAALEALRAERAGLRYELANALFLSLGRADSAAALYAQVLAETPDAPVAPRALFALAELEWAAGDTARAAARYRTLLARDVPPELAAAARLRLGEPEPDAETGDAQAERAYEAARQRWLAGDPAGAVRDLLALSEAAPPRVAPRAALAAAVAAAEWIRHDGRDLHAPLPDSLLPPALAGGDPVTLRALLARVEAQHAGTPYARQALAHRQALPPPPVAAAEHAAEGAAGVAPAEAVPATEDAPEAPEPAAAPGTSPPAAMTPEDVAAERRRRLLEAERVVFDPPPGAEPPAEQEETADLAVADRSPEQIAAAPEGTFGLRGAAPLDASQGGYTWRVQAIPSALAADALLRTYLRRGYRAALALETRTDGLDLYLVLVGQFGTRADGLAARPDLPPEGQGTAAALVPLAPLQLLESNAPPPRE